MTERDRGEWGVKKSQIQREILYGQPLERILSGQLSPLFAPFPLYDPPLLAPLTLHRFPWPPLIAPLPITRFLARSAPGPAPSCATRTQICSALFSAIHDSIAVLSKVQSSLLIIYLFYYCRCVTYWIKTGCSWNIPKNQGQDFIFTIPIKSRFWPNISSYEVIVSNVSTYRIVQCKLQLDKLFRLPMLTYCVGGAI